MTVTTPTYHQSAWPDATLKAWHAAVQRDLKGAPFEKRLVTKTYEGLSIQPLYTRADWDHACDPTGRPGSGTRVRGARTLGVTRTGWSVCEERGEADPEALNAAILDDLVHGADAIDIRLDTAPCNEGLRAAVLMSVDDLDRALDGVHLSMVSLGFTPGSAFAEVAGFAKALFDRRGEATETARIAFNADPIAELARTGTLPGPVGAMLDRLGALAVWTDANLPGAISVRVSTAPYHDANATASQDLACSIATGLAYLRAMERAGLAPDRAARQIVFRFSLSTNVFLAVAKLRAARRLWNNVLDRCGIADDNRVMRLESRTANRSLTHRDPWVNMLRNTAACFAGVIGGADTIVSVPFDEPLGTPDGLARRIARNTQTILSGESNLHRVIDPAGGSYYIEHLTDDLAKAAWETFREIERAGGMPAAFEAGPLRGWIAEAYTARLRNIGKRKDAVTGVSEFPLVRETAPMRPPADPEAVLAGAVRRLEARDPNPRRESLLTTISDASAVSIGTLVDAAEAGASLRELSGAINRGLAPELTEPFAPQPYAEPFEQLRDASDAYAAERGRRPSVALIAVGPPSEHTARTNFMKGFFEAGGFEVYTPGAFDGAHAAADGYGRLCDEHAVEIAAICAADPRYPELVPALAPRLHAAGARTVVLAGRPGDAEEVYRTAGVDRFVFMGCDVLRTLTELMHEEGAIS